MKKIFALIISLSIIVSAIAPVSATTEAISDDIVILYTNDVHTYIDGALSYDVIAAFKENLEKQYKYVILADAGDHIQGTAYGSMDKGESIIKMMNVADYDVATLGNHEFDYGMEGCLKVIDLAEFPYVSANFYHEKNGVRGENVLDSYVMFDCGDEKLAIVGITTPETFEKSTTAYFQDESGNFIYGISAGEDGSELRQDVQKAVDQAKEAGATKIVALGHLGIDPSSQPWTSRETVGGVCGLDAFIDGHSHSIVEKEIVKDKDGHDVLLTQTGEYFNRIGMMVIDSETDEITSDFIEYEEIIADDGKTVSGGKLASDLYSGTDLVSDETVNEIKAAWITEIDEKLGQKIGSTELTFDNYDPEGNRLVRIQETNSGDFAADALYYLFDNMELDVDVAAMNGGGIRNHAITGDISYKTCKDMHTFGNVACLQTVTGQQVLDALEWGARNIGVGENGGFLHTSGVKYKVDTSVPNTVKEDEMGTWQAGPDSYRVYDVEVYNKETASWEALDLNASYNMAGYNYTLRDFGDGYAMFDGAVNVVDYVMEDYMVLANYVQSFEDGIVGADNSPLISKYPGFMIDYSTVNGSGRIVIGSGADTAAFEDVAESDWYYADVEYALANGLMNGTTETAFSPDANVTRAMLVNVLYRAEGELAANRSIPFADVDMGAYYAGAVSWAKQNGIVNGVTETEFAPDDNITREQIAAIIHRYAQYKGYDISVVGENINILSYSDFDSISEYAAGSVQWAVGSGLIKGKTESTLNPLDFASRAEIAAILHRFIGTL
ncbi:MAG: S-layer homology domain-containing protein [Clostridia bacterium]|nr:S-layer homology domain-containing protein [Clostridia bacterium]